MHISVSDKLAFVSGHGDSRMSKRSEIIDGRLAATARSGVVYTEVLGWIDLGHARGDDNGDEV